MIACIVLTLSVLAMPLVALVVEEPDPQGPRWALPQAEGLTAKLVLPGERFVLDPQSSGQAFARMIRQQELPGRRPEPPTIDGALVITNTGDRPRTVNIGGDMSRVEIRLEGPGAVSVPSNMMMTMEFREGRTVELKPGDSLEIPVPRLAWGMRGISEFGYWTEPGQYTLEVSYVTVTDGGERAVVIPAEPVKVWVGPEDKSGLEASLGGTLEYAFDPALTGLTAERARSDRVPPPTVRLKLVLTNTSERPVRFNVGSDATAVELRLEGEGAINVGLHPPMSREFRGGEWVTLAPGESHEIPIDSLAHGMRGLAAASYWTAPGTYRLHARYKTHVGEQGAERTLTLDAGSVELRVNP